MRLKPFRARQNLQAEQGHSYAWRRHNAAHVIVGVLQWQSCDVNEIPLYDPDLPVQPYKEPHVSKAVGLHLPSCRAFSKHAVSPPVPAALVPLSARVICKQKQDECKVTHSRLCSLVKVWLLINGFLVFVRCTTSRAQATSLFKSAVAERANLV